MPSVRGHGRSADEKVRRCTAIARSTGRRCGRYPRPGSNVCVFHGKSGNVARAAAHRMEVADALRDGIPHPAYVFFELLSMRWSLSADGTELTCTVPTDQLGTLADVRGGLAWVNHWDTVMTYLRHREAEVTRKRRVRRADADQTP